MEPSRIVGADVKTALRMVREQLGPDALVLSNRRVSGGVEILACRDGHYADPVAVQPGLVSVRASVPLAESPTRADLSEADAQGYVAVSKPRAQPAPPRSSAAGADSAPQIAEMQNELRIMRSILETRLTELRVDHASEGRGIEGRVWRRLSEMGIPNVLVREIVAGIPATENWHEAWSDVLSRLTVGLRAAGDIVEEGGVFAFVGPTGAGKTTSLCKLAVRHVLKHGSEGIALVSMDNVRLGGSDMLRSLARLLDVECHTLSADEALADTLRQLRGKQLVLIDTAGINRKFRHHIDQLEALGSMRDRLRTLLVLPANAQLSSLHAATADYASVGPAACIVTKLDETQSLGEIIGVLSARHLPLAYSTDGQEIPDDLRVCVSAELIAHALLLCPAAGEARRTPAADTGPAARAHGAASRAINTARIA